MFTEALSPRYKLLRASSQAGEGPVKDLDVNGEQQMTESGFCRWLQVAASLLHKLPTYPWQTMIWG